MTKRIQLREMTEEEQRVLMRLSTSRKAEAALVRRSTMIVRYYAGDLLRQIGQELHADA